MAELQKKSDKETEVKGIRKHASVFWRVLFNRPILKFVVLFTLIAIFSFIKFFFFPSLQNSWPVYVLAFLILLFFVYFGLLIFHIIIEHVVKRSIKNLLHAKNFGSLFASYAFFVFGVIMLFAVCMNAMEDMDLGYIKYGQCSDSFDKKLIEVDPTHSEEYFYFSAVTFFTVGYGDLCPMGALKYFAILIAFVGNVVNVIVMVIVINSYLIRKNDGS